MSYTLPSGVCKADAGPAKRPFTAAVISFGGTLASAVSAAGATSKICFRILLVWHLCNKHSISMFSAHHELTVMHTHVLLLEYCRQLCHV